MQYAVAQQSSPSPLISTTQASVFNPSSSSLSSAICNPDRVTWGSQANLLLLNARSSWNEMKVALQLLKLPNYCPQTEAIWWKEQIDLNDSD